MTPEIGTPQPVEWLLILGVFWLPAAALIVWALVHRARRNRGRDG